jgi:hypothetical protein
MMVRTVGYALFTKDVASLRVPPGRPANCSKRV